jgi:hypothetical protein
MQEGKLGDIGGPPNGRPDPWTHKSARLKAATAAISIVTLFALMAVLGTANRVWAQSCGGSLTPVIQKAGRNNEQWTFQRW